MADPASFLEFSAPPDRRLDFVLSLSYYPTTPLCAQWHPRHSAGALGP